MIAVAGARRTPGRLKTGGVPPKPPATIFPSLCPSVFWDFGSLFRTLRRHFLTRCRGSRLIRSEIQNWFTPGSSRIPHNDHVIHGMSLVTEVIDSCSQAGVVPQAMGVHGPTPCRRQKEEVDVPTFLLQTSLATSVLFDKTRSFRVRDCCPHAENPVTGGEDTGCTGERVASTPEELMELQNKFSREQWFGGSFSNRGRSYSSSS